MKHSNAAQIMLKTTKILCAAQHIKCSVGLDVQSKLSERTNKKEETKKKLNVARPVITYFVVVVCSSVVSGLGFYSIMRITAQNMQIMSIVYTFGFYFVFFSLSKRMCSSAPVDIISFVGRQKCGCKLQIGVKTDNQFSCFIDLCILCVSLFIICWMRVTSFPHQILILQIHLITYTATHTLNLPFSIFRI